MIPFGDEENNRRRKVKALLYSERPALRDTCIPKLVKKTAQKGDIQKKYSDGVTAALDNCLVLGNKVISKSGYSEQRVHGVDTGHAIFKVLLKPLAGEMK